MSDNDGPLRVGVAGDWHGNTMWAVSQIRAMCARLGPNPVILHAGDFGVWPGEVGDAYLDAVNMELARHHAKLFFVDGNHDDHEQLAHPCGMVLRGVIPGAEALRPDGNEVWHLPRGLRWVWRGRTWLALGGAASVDRSVLREGEEWWPGEYITDADVAKAKEGGKVDVLLSHDAPARVRGIYLNPSPPSWWLPEDLACSEVMRGMLQDVCNETEPLYVIHGHHHQGLVPVRWRGEEFSYGEVGVASLGADGQQSNWGILNVETMEWE